MLDTLVIALCTLAIVLYLQSRVQARRIRRRRARTPALARPLLIEAAPARRRGG